MSTNKLPGDETPGTTEANREASVRPTIIHLGTDGDGAHHSYRTSDETVHVVADGERVHVQDLGDRSVEHWMAYIEGGRGWAHQHYGVSAVELLQEWLGEGED